MHQSPLSGVKSRLTGPYGRVHWQTISGNASFVSRWKFFLAAARQRGEPLDHTLIFGPPGLGKTTLASIIAHEMGVALKTTSGPVLEKAGDIAALMTNLEPGDVLFIR